MDADFAWLDRPPPRVSAAAAESHARTHFGLGGTAQPLYAERDRNFRLRISADDSFLLKFSNEGTGLGTLKFQVRAMSHAVHADPALPVPNVLQDRDGERLVAVGSGGANRCWMQVHEWVPGVHRKLAELERPARRALGAMLGRLDQALADCPADGAPTDLLWDLRNTVSLRPLKSSLRDAGLAAIVDDRLERFERIGLPGLEALTTQPIHNDFNSGNVLFDEANPTRITGIIDFGDMIAAPRICELAVACAYQISTGDSDPVSELTPMLAAYVDVCPIGEAEWRLLPLLVECRLITTLLIQGWRAGAGPDPDGDFTATATEAARRLRRMADLGPGGWKRLRRASAGADTA